MKIEKAVVSTIATYDCGEHANDDLHAWLQTIGAIVPDCPNRIHQHNFRIAEASLIPDGAKGQHGQITLVWYEGQLIGHVVWTHDKEGCSVLTFTATEEHMARVAKQKVQKALRATPDLTITQLAAAIGLSEDMVWRSLSAMGDVKEVKPVSVPDGIGFRLIAAPDTPSEQN